MINQELYIVLLIVILLIIVYISMVLHARMDGRTFHEDLMPSWYLDEFPEDEFQGDLAYEEEVNKGKLLASEEHLVIGGLIYNMDECNVSMLSKRLDYVSEGWKTVTIVVYGLDSKYPYNAYLKDWSERDNRVKLIPKIDRSWSNVNVFVKMSVLRNILHDYCSKIVTGYNTFFLSMDYDIGGPISRDGLYHARYVLEDKSIDAVYANGIVSDSFINTIPGFKGLCYPGIGFCYYDDLALIINDDDESKIYKWWKATRDRTYGLLYCKSAYGGAGLMRLSTLSTSRFDEKTTVCEHHSFNKSLKGHVVVDPKFMLLAGCQGHHLTRKV